MLNFDHLEMQSECDFNEHLFTFQVMWMAQMRRKTFSVYGEKQSVVSMLFAAYFPISSPLTWLSSHNKY